VGGGASTEKEAAPCAWTKNRRAEAHVGPKRKGGLANRTGTSSKGGKRNAVPNERAGGRGKNLNLKGINEGGLTGVKDGTPSKKSSQSAGHHLEGVRITSRGRHQGRRWGQTGRTDKWLEKAQARKVRVSNRKLHWVCPQGENGRRKFDQNEMSRRKTLHQKIRRISQKVPINAARKEPARRKGWVAIRRQFPRRAQNRARKTSVRKTSGGGDRPRSGGRSRRSPKGLQGGEGGLNRTPMSEQKQHMHWREQGKRIRAVNKNPPGGHRSDAKKGFASLKKIQKGPSIPLVGQP